MKINQAGLDLIKRFESCKLEAYLCPAGKWTIGYGHTGDVKPGDKITQHQADVILEYDLDKFQLGVGLVAADANENQFSAMVCLAFNIGLRAFQGSRLLMKFQDGDYDGAAREFGKWTRAGGKVLAGLVKRRQAERELFTREV